MVLKNIVTKYFKYKELRGRHECIYSGDLEIRGGWCGTVQGRNSSSNFSVEFDSHEKHGGRLHFGLDFLKYIDTKVKFLDSQLRLKLWMKIGQP